MSNNEYDCVELTDKEKYQIKESLARLAHKQWTGWMKYLFSKCERREDGSLVIPKWAVDRWTHQIRTPYHKLTEAEKASNRKEAVRVLETITTQTL